jgi:hypothetical protein
MFIRCLPAPNPWIGTYRTGSAGAPEELTSLQSDCWHRGPPPVALRSPPWVHASEHACPTEIPLLIPWLVRPLDKSMTAKPKFRLDR